MSYVIGNQRGTVPRPPLREHRRCTGGVVEIFHRVRGTFAPRRGRRRRSLFGSDSPALSHSSMPLRPQTNHPLPAPFATTTPFLHHRPSTVRHPQTQQEPHYPSGDYHRGHHRADFACCFGLGPCSGPSSVPPGVDRGWNRKQPSSHDWKTSDDAFLRSVGPPVRSSGCSCNLRVSSADAFLSRSLRYYRKLL